MLLFKKRLLLPVFAFAMLMADGCLGNAAQAAIYVRDAETENTVRAYSTPIFEAAGLDPRSVNIYLIHDNQLNAFVAGGQNIFIYTGLLLNAKSSLEVIGVIAHETGHILGGHLIRTKDAIDSARSIGVLSSIIGIGAGLLTGRGDVAGALATGGAGVATGDFLSYSRAQESVADQSALRLLEATGQSARGIADFLRLLEGQELVSARNQDAYARTHPLSRDRIDTVLAHLENSRYSDVPPDPVHESRHQRIRAKVYAYTYPLRTVLREYPESDQSLAARYARTFAYYRQPNIEKATEGIDALIAEMPDDPYFHELKAQMIFENGDAAGAVPFYQKAADLEPRSALLLQLLGKAQIATENPALLAEATRSLRASVAIEPRFAAAWRQLAIAYGRQGDLGRSALALAEEALIRGKTDEARHHAGKAETMFPTGSREWIRANDILNAIDVKDSP